MAFVSSRNPVSANALKRKPRGAVVVHHWSSSEVRFTRVHGGWKREDSPAEVVASADVARECNMAIGCKDSWAKVY